MIALHAHGGGMPAQGFHNGSKETCVGPPHWSPVHRTCVCWQKCALRQP